MLPYVDTVMRVILNRLSISTKSLSHLIQATASLFRKQQSNDSAPTANGVVPLIFEMLLDGLRMKARILPSTLRSMLEVSKLPFEQVARLSLCFRRSQPQISQALFPQVFVIFHPCSDYWTLVFISSSTMFG